MKLKNILMASLAVSALTASADMEYLYWMVDTTDNPSVEEFSYATVRASGSDERLAFYNTSGEPVGTDLLVNNYGGSTTSGKVAGPLYTGLDGSYLPSDSSFIFELWLEGADGDARVGQATYLYSQLMPYIYSTMANDGNLPLSVAAIPEPSSALLLLLGLAGLVLRRRRA